MPKPFLQRPYQTTVEAAKLGHGEGGSELSHGSLTRLDDVMDEVGREARLLGGEQGRDLVGHIGEHGVDKIAVGGDGGHLVVGVHRCRAHALALVVERVPDHTLPNKVELSTVDTDLRGKGEKARAEGPAKRNQVDPERLLRLDCPARQYDSMTISI
jgi:hypothetical protein